jgi:hypothetical protein
MGIRGGEVIDLTAEHCLCYGDPELEGRLVVYEGWRTGQYNVWLVDVDTLAEENLSQGSAPQFDPTFDGRWVVWTDGRNDPSADPYGYRVNPDIYGMELASGVEEPLCDHPATQLYPDVRDGLVAWEDYRNAEDPNGAWVEGANVDVYLLDLATRREIQVTSLPGAERQPRVVGTRVYFIAADLLGQDAVFVVDLVAAGLVAPR